MSGAQQFRDFAADLGYELPQNIEPGRRFRFSANGKRADDAGWGIWFSDGEGGVIGDWRTGDKHVWQAKRDRKPSPEEYRAWQERIEREKREAEAERERAYAEAAARARQIDDKAERASNDHPYLRGKGVRAHGVEHNGRYIGVKLYRGDLVIAGMRCDGALIVPMRDAQGDLHSLQFIAPDGEKRYLTGGRVQGCYSGIGKPPRAGEPLLIGEGYATVASAHHATGYGGVAAFDAGNLPHVAAAMRAKYPQAQIVICADNDIAEGKPNVGLESAREAAKAIGARVAVPEMDGRKCDFNDLARAKGLEAVKRAIDTQPDVAVVTAPAAPAPAAGDSTITVEHFGANSQVAGVEILDAVYEFLGRFVAYPSDDARVAHVLWIAHAHMMDAWESTPRIAFLSPEPGSGKTRALEITETLVPRPVEAVSATPAYLFRKVSDEAGPPTLLYDEIDTVFGPRAKENEEIRGMLNAGHRRGAIAGRCVVRGKSVETEELPAYCAVALAGLDDLPDTIRSRTVVIRMRRRAPGEKVEPYRRRLHAPQGNTIRDRLAAWAPRVMPQLRGAWPQMPPGIEDRDADVWEALLAVADAAGREWPTRARGAAVALVAAGKATAPSFGVRLLSDLRTIFRDRDAMHSVDIVAALVVMDEAPWADMRGKPIDQRRLAKQLRKYGIESDDVRIGAKVLKGYQREWLHDAWERYLGPSPLSPAKCATSATAATADDSEAEVIA
jgi:phage/plasmid primase-like uncharacterized protein